MTNELSAILPSLGILGLFAVIALFLTFSRGWAYEDSALTRRAVQIAVVAILFQAAHFTEELFTGFNERFPALFGIGPMSPGVFVAFNVAWLICWSLCAWGLAARYRAALFPLWFLSIACIANGVAHPALSLVAGGYFPGLVTSPVVGILGVLLFRRLLSVTKTVDASPKTA